MPAGPLPLAPFQHPLTEAEADTSHRHPLENLPLPSHPVSGDSPPLTALAECWHEGWRQQRLEGTCGQDAISRGPQPPGSQGGAGPDLPTVEVLPRSCPCLEPSCPLFWSWPWRWGGAGLEVRTSRLRGPGVSASRGGRAWLSLQKVQPWAEGGYLSHLEAPLNLGAWGQHLLNFRCHPDKCCPSHAQGTRTPASASRTPPARSLDASEGPGIRQALRVQQGQREGTGSCAQGSHRVWGHRGKGAATLLGVPRTGVTAWGSS